MEENWFDLRGVSSFNINAAGQHRKPVVQAVFLLQCNIHGRESCCAAWDRAMCYNREFAYKIIGMAVDNYWDMHLLDVLSHWGTIEYERNPKNYKKFLACVVDPSIFEHIPSFEKRFRGSGRLESSAVNAAEETSYYITLALTHEWGAVNRLRFRGSGRLESSAVNAIYLLEGLQGVSWQFQCHELF